MMLMILKMWYAETTLKCNCFISFCIYVYFSHGGNEYEGIAHQFGMYNITISKKQLLNRVNWKNEVYKVDPFSQLFRVKVVFSLWPSHKECFFYLDASKILYIQSRWTIPSTLSEQGYSNFKLKGRRGESWGWGGGGVEGKFACSVVQLIIQDF